MLAPSRRERAPPELAAPLRIATLAIPFWSISGVLLFATQALRVMSYAVTIKRVLEPTALIAIAIALYWAGWVGIGGLSVAMVLSTAFGAAAAV